MATALVKSPGTRTPADWELPQPSTVPSALNAKLQPPPKATARIPDRPAGSPNGWRVPHVLTLPSGQDGHRLIPACRYGQHISKILRNLKRLRGNLLPPCNYARDRQIELASRGRASRIVDKQSIPTRLGREQVLKHKLGVRCSGQIRCIKLPLVIRTQPHRDWLPQQTLSRGPRCRRRHIEEMR